MSRSQHFSHEEIEDVSQVLRRWNSRKQRIITNIWALTGTAGFIGGAAVGAYNLSAGFALAATVCGAGFFGYDYYLGRRLPQSIAVGAGMGLALGFASVATHIDDENNDAANQSGGDASIQQNDSASHDTTSMADYSTRVEDERRVRFYQPAPTA